MNLNQLDKLLHLPVQTVNLHDLYSEKEEDAMSVLRQRRFSLATFL